MGAVRTVAITGAGGFVGKRLVREAHRRNLAVRAILRRGAAPEGMTEAEVHRLDLAEGGAPLARALDGADALIHAAGHMGNDARAHDRDTHRATEALLAAAEEAGIARVVLLGSVAVYDVSTLADDGSGIVTEATPLVTGETAPDAYAAAKARQDRDLSAWAKSSGTEAWLLRAGAIYGPGRIWTTQLGARVGPLTLRLGGGGEVPVVDVERVARACLDAAETPPPGGLGVLNLLDDALPDRAGMVRALRTSGACGPAVSVPWRALLPVARALSGIKSRPGLLRAATLRARYTPLRWPNDALRAAFPDRDRESFEDRIAVACRSEAT
ncbi:NAD-dependent epimerase/dehydratase family protein [Roseivivax marinus]|uniref:NAD-dependent epimerase/dehydratase family protein n=1 Tax=Roseivivax marinus TaxID=1379903 RepID=UPI00273E21D5|nr:NAD-dependent epimerase/dehydratase family protein [Roseivivax marinus]